MDGGNGRFGWFKDFLVEKCLTNSIDNGHVYCFHLFIYEMELG